MPAQALYRKWRPQLWDEVVGQGHVVQTLRNALRMDHVAHAYLFAGPRGCGKTTSARLVAKALNCLHPDPAQRPDTTCAHCVAVAEGRFLDLIEIDGASNNGVENIRELRDKINFAPSEGRYKIYVIDEVHMLSTPAFNALLKTLEEPPPHAIFILATTESHKIPATVTSRCQRFEFRRISVTEMIAHLKVLCESEGIRVEEAALAVIARQATGSLRDAISLLDQLVAADMTVTLAGAQALLGATVGESVQSLVDAVAAHDISSGLAIVNAAIDAGADPRQLARQMVDYLRGLMLVRLGSAALVEATAEVRAAMARQAQAIEVSALLRAIRAFNAAANDVKGGWQPQLPLEMAIVECATPPMSASPPAETEQAARPPAPGPLTPTPSQTPETASTARPADVNRPKTPVEDSDLRASWSRLLTMMHAKDKPTEALLRSCTVLGLHGTTLRLSANEFVSKQINDNAETRQRIEVLLAEVLGFPCGVKCQRADKGHSRRAAVEDIPHDGMVATALDLGGEIVE